MWFKQRNTGVKWYHRLNQLSRPLQYLHPSTPEHISFSPVCGIPSKIGHIFGHKWSRSKRRKSDMISSIPSDHSGTSWKSAAIEATANSKTNVVSAVYSWIVIESLKRSRRKFKKFLELSENEDTAHQNLWDTMKP